MIRVPKYSSPYLNQISKKIHIPVEQAKCVTPTIAIVDTGVDLGSIDLMKQIDFYDNIDASGSGNIEFSKISKDSDFGPFSREDIQNISDKLSIDIDDHFHYGSTLIYRFFPPSLSNEIFSWYIEKFHKFLSFKVTRSEEVVSDEFKTITNEEDRVQVSREIENLKSSKYMEKFKHIDNIVSKIKKDKMNISTLPRDVFLKNYEELPLIFLSSLRVKKDDTDVVLPKIHIDYKFNDLFLEFEKWMEIEGFSNFLNIEEIANNGFLRHFKDYRDIGKIHAKFLKRDLLFSADFKPFGQENVICFVCPSGAHGTHVASITANVYKDTVSNFIENTELPLPKIVSIKISDPMVESGLETFNGLSNCGYYLLANPVNFINMSFGEGSMSIGQNETNTGFFTKLINQIVYEKNSVFLSSAGNEGPCLSSVGTPGGTDEAVIGVGAVMSKDMATSLYNYTPETKEDCTSYRPYIWQSRGPNISGGRGVDIVAPGGSIASVPSYIDRRSALMNGTSMSSPYATGLLAASSFVIKANLVRDNETVPKLPASLFKKIAMITSMEPLDEECRDIDAKYAGLIQINDFVDKFIEIMKSSNFNIFKNMNLCLTSTCSISPTNVKNSSNYLSPLTNINGIYIRDEKSKFLLKNKSPISLKIKVDLELFRVNNVCSNGYKNGILVNLVQKDANSGLIVKLPSEPIVLNSGLNNREIDCHLYLEENNCELAQKGGVLFTEIYGYTDDILVLNIPVTVVIPLEQIENTSIEFNKFSGISRHYLSISPETSGIEVNIHSPCTNTNRILWIVASYITDRRVVIEKLIRFNKINQKSTKVFLPLNGVNYQSIVELCFGQSPLEGASISNAFENAPFQVEYREISNIINFNKNMTTGLLTDVLYSPGVLNSHLYGWQCIGNLHIDCQKIIDSINLKLTNMTLIKTLSPEPHLTTNKSKYPINLNQNLHAYLQNCASNFSNIYTLKLYYPLSGLLNIPKIGEMESLKIYPFFDRKIINQNLYDSTDYINFHWSLIDETIPKKHSILYHGETYEHYFQLNKSITQGKILVEISSMNISKLREIESANLSLKITGLSSLNSDSISINATQITNSNKSRNINNFEILAKCSPSKLVKIAEPGDVIVGDVEITNIKDVNGYPVNIVCPTDDVKNRTTVFHSFSSMLNSEDETLYMNSKFITKCNMQISTKPTEVKPPTNLAEVKIPDSWVLKDNGLKMLLTAVLSEKEKYQNFHFLREFCNLDKLCIEAPPVYLIVMIRLALLQESSSKKPTKKIEIDSALKNLKNIPPILLHYVKALKEVINLRALSVDYSDEFLKLKEEYQCQIVKTNESYHTHVKKFISKDKEAGGEDLKKFQSSVNDELINFYKHRIEFDSSIVDKWGPCLARLRFKK